MRYSRAFGDGEYIVFEKKSSIMIKENNTSWVYLYCGSNKISKQSVAVDWRFKLQKAHV